MNKIDLSIIITMHAEGILVHRTLASVRRAAAHLAQQNISYELILHADNPTPATDEYLAVHKEHLNDVTLLINHFGDLGQSRNAAVKKAQGKYITFIDGDDLMSEWWLVKGYQFLELQPYGQYIAHTEKTIEFGGADALVIKHGEINQETDTLLSVFANRWNSIIMAPRPLLLEEPYTPNSPGFGYEDWHFNCRMIARGIHNVLIPETVIFVRRKESNSEWLRQIQSRAVLRANPLFSFDRIRKIEMLSNDAEAGTAGVAITPPMSKKQKLKAKAAPIIKKSPGAERYLRKLYGLTRKAAHTAHNTLAETSVPSWLQQEWRAMHSIDKQVFPSEHLLKHIPTYDSLTPDHYKTGEAFKKIIDRTTNNSYDYIIFVPWLMRGGADLIAIYYANEIKKLRANKNVLVVATLPQDSPWAAKLENVDFIPFGTLTEGLGIEVQYRLLEQLIENSGATHLHIINSELAYNFAYSHEQYIKSTDKTVIATSFSQSTDESGRIFGYSHTHVPKIYDLTTCITSDNQAVIDMWANEYGFNPAKLLLHRQPVFTPKLKYPDRPVIRKKLHVLWAARLSPEKQPELVAQIAKLIKDHDITIDMYGHVDEGFNTDFLNTLPSNVHYKGGYDGFFTLPLEKYDAYLYTSLFDGMPNAILEAAAAKLSIVSSGVGSIPSFITDKQDGIIVTDLTDPHPYANALITLSKDPSLLAAYSNGLHKQLLAKHSEAAYKKQITEFLHMLGY